MIKSFKHKGLKHFFLTVDSSKLQPNHIKKIRLLLANLNAATSIENMDLPGLNFHKIHGDKAGFWSVTIDSNWRLIFCFENGDAY